MPSNCIKSNNITFITKNKIFKKGEEINKINTWTAYSTR